MIKQTLRTDFMTNKGLHALGALEELLHGPDVCLRSAAADLSSGQCLSPEQSCACSLCSTGNSDIQAGIQSCLSQERLFLNQWFATLLTEFHGLHSRLDRLASASSTNKVLSVPESSVSRQQQHLQELESQLTIMQEPLTEGSVSRQEHHLQKMESQLTVMQESLKHIDAKILSSEVASHNTSQNLEHRLFSTQVRIYNMEKSVTNLAEQVTSVKAHDECDSSNTIQHGLESVQERLKAIEQSLTGVHQSLQTQTAKRGDDAGTANLQDVILDRVEKLSHQMTVHNTERSVLKSLHRPPSAHLTSKLSFLSQANQESKTNYRGATNSFTSESDERCNDNVCSREDLHRVSQVQLHRINVERRRYWTGKVELVSSIIVLLNTLFLGFEVDIAVSAKISGSSPPRWLFIVDSGIAGAFVIELACKIAIERCDFFRGPDRSWHMLDVFLVASAVAEHFALFANISFMRTIRVLRALRGVRLIRSLRFVRELRLMLASILCSGSCLFWAFVLLSCVLYLFSVFIMQGILYVHDDKKIPSNSNLLEYYGSLGATMMSLFMAISGGMDWNDLIQPLLEMSQWYYALFVFYLLFVLFGMMNILTAIFCESAGQIAEIDRDYVVQEQKQRDAATVDELKRVFREFDEDESGCLDEKEFKRILNDRRTLDYLKTLDVEIQEATSLFTLLDTTESGYVGIEEFVATLMRLKGNAKAIDLATVMYENKRVSSHMTKFMRHAVKQLQLLTEALSIDEDVPPSQSLARWT